MDCEGGFEQCGTQDDVGDDDDDDGDHDVSATLLKAPFTIHLC